MGTIFRHMLRRLRGSVLGFGLALFLIAWPLLAAYEIVQREQEKITELVQNFPMLVTAMGGNLDELASPSGYLSMRYFTFMPLLLGVLACLVGSGLLVSDEENGTLDLVLAHPIARTSLFLGRWLAFVLALVLVLLLGWLGLVAARQQFVVPVSTAALVLPFLSLLAVLLFFGNLALLLSMALPSRRLAAGTAVMVLVGGFFLTLFARIDPMLKPFAFLSPLDYYQGGDAIKGLDLASFFGMLLCAGAFAGLAWWCFEQRDIRVVGEGTWRWPLWRRAA